MRNARLRRCQSESWRRIGKYVAKPAFFLRGLRVFNFVLVPNLER